jgi:hypothetical protein
MSKIINKQQLKALRMRLKEDLSEYRNTVFKDGVLKSFIVPNYLQLHFIGCWNNDQFFI